MMIDESGWLAADLLAYQHRSECLLSVFLLPTMNSFCKGELRLLSAPSSILYPGKLVPCTKKTGSHSQTDFHFHREVALLVTEEYFAGSALVSRRC